MTTHSLSTIVGTLNAATWDEPYRSRGREASALALTIYAGHTRDQGTPYLEHPLAVVTVLRDELAVTDPDTLILGLLHDALEVSPDAGPLLAAQMGEDFTERLRAMTPAHRLEMRSKQPGDEGAWRSKTAGLEPAGLLVRFADRIHNLRDLQQSPDPGRRQKFVSTLADFYLPLAKAASPFNTHLELAYTLLHTEYERLQRGGQEARI
ncbi:bifunctional (p)ppGpp synthetase/guanosine-3',5'-bis(diphosphate) 3'-pyrophosphohydrolase [Streptomyces sp. So13.3]|uniref:HD domain-containing protein n=1 Tax=Streptomyces sp. So13.3 TaxID=2136173 RepID=UPI0011059033|nr:HD domain-containing protein [Streptomyces sp. So13.3]QNA72035.1 bifunctional (p)ppGpp synthetase/guanosine-3',5'-bis(diphosphate) 3'-pyrophosphohydrolase [Streptomyces sp. So13.3]